MYIVSVQTRRKMQSLHIKDVLPEQQQQKIVLLFMIV